MSQLLFSVRSIRFVTLPVLIIDLLIDGCVAEQVLLIWDLSVRYYDAIIYLSFIRFTIAFVSPQVGILEAGEQ